MLPIVFYLGNMPLMMKYCAVIYCKCKNNSFCCFMDIQNMIKRIQLLYFQGSCSNATSRSFNADIALWVWYILLLSLPGTSIALSKNNSFYFVFDNGRFCSKWQWELNLAVTSTLILWFTIVNHTNFGLYGQNGKKILK